MAKKLLKVYNPLPSIRKDGYETFKTYCLVKAHFNGSYDLKKYSVSSKITKDAFSRRSDKFFFNKIAEKFTIEHNYMIFVHNFLHNSDKSVFDLMDQDAIDIYQQRNANVINAYSNYIKDINYLFEYMEVHKLKFKELIYSDSIHPPILKMVIQGFITIESFMILDSILGLINKIESGIPDYDPLWPTASPKLKCYKKILDIDTEMANAIFKEIVNKYKKSVQ